MTIELYNSVETPSKVVIAGKEVEKVSSYKYLDTLIDDKRSWVENTNLIIWKHKNGYIYWGSLSPLMWINLYW